MSKIHAIRAIGFDSGHRVVNHESKCRTLHGHRYTCELYATTKELDSLGRVIDFSILKSVIGNWIDEQWDHAMIIWNEDPDLELLQKCSGMKPVFVTDFNPTAENLANHLLTKVCPALLKDTDVKITKIRLWETPNCYVEAELND